MNNPKTMIVESEKINGSQSQSAIETDKKPNVVTLAKMTGLSEINQKIELKYKIDKIKQVTETNAYSLKINLITSYYRASSMERQLELDECLTRNSENPLIDRIILLIDDEASLPVQSEKIEIRKLDKRPTFADWLSVTEEMQLQGAVLLANSDIYFDESLILVHQVLSEPSILMALSRWEVEAGSTRQHPNPHWSQDVWAISAGTPQVDLDQIRERLGIRLGVPRCDNKVAYVFASAGWSIRNPFNFLRSYHLQASQERNYDRKADKTIVGAVAYVEPSLALDKNSALHFDVWTVKPHDVVSVTVNNSLDKWKKQAANMQDEHVWGIAKTVNSKLASAPSARQDIFNNGKRIYANHAGMSIYEKDNRLLVAPSFHPRDWMVIDKSLPFHPEFTRQFFKPVLDDHLSNISERPKNETDVNFWQYPCRTEQQALDNHLSIREPSIDQATRTINVYVPLPWATYIDNKEFPKPILTIITNRLDFLAHLAKSLGYILKAHTVCQHIRWRNIREIAVQIGISDLHISHCTAQARAEMAATNSSLHLHPWTLYAVNYCDPTRNQGLVAGKPMRERKYLASFIGAHMPHYLSDIRLRLHEELSALNADDIVTDLGDLWHFNQVVYEHQVARKNTSQVMPVNLEEKTYRYNQVLSDSRFSLCPEGAGPNTLRLWESIAVGAVPVLFNQSLELPEKIRGNLIDSSVFWEGAEFGSVFVDWLRSFSSEVWEYKKHYSQMLFIRSKDLCCF
jgi:hypothetical protein